MSMLRTATHWVCLLALAALVASNYPRATAQTVDRTRRTAAAEQEAQEDEAEARRSRTQDGEDDKKKNAEPKPKVTHHTVTIAGKEIAYTATAGKMLMQTDAGEPKAHVFYIAYTVGGRDEETDQADEGDDDESKDDEGEDDEESADDDADRDNGDEDNGDEDNGDEDNGDEDDGDADGGNEDDGDADDEVTSARGRPVTFCFNGGPGSSSVWLHLGMLGPARVKLDSDAKPLPPPHEIIANPYSLLDVTDLVFIDPVSTGFSRPAEGEDKRQFHGYEQDVRSVGQFIHDYTTKYARWGSPKFLLGESYGGIRAAGLSGELRNRYHIELNGIVLISAVVDFQTLAAGGHNDIAYALFLPTYAATAWYHKALEDELQDQSVEEVVAAAEEFAAGPYLQALAAGDSLPQNRRRRIVNRMSELTGLNEDYLDAANLRVSMARFGKELLRDRRRVVGRFDSRYIGIDRTTLGETAEHDPSGDAVFGTFTSALNDYLRTTLKVEEPRVYEILTGNVHPWDYSSFANRYVDASETLRHSMTMNPYLKVYAACGYYDLATPQFAMEYTRDHLGLAREVRDNFSMGYYEAGHMMYAHEPSLKKLRKDLLKFYEEALPERASDEEDEADED